MTFALIIDGDNTSSKYIREVIDLLREKGKILIKRVYGDFSEENMKNWKRVCQEFLIEPVQVWRINHKNSSDQKITADCTELLYSFPMITHYVLVTGDGDFTHLITKWKSNNKHVIGISTNSQATCKYLELACDEFIYIDHSLRSMDSTTLLMNIKNILSDRPEMLISQLKEKLLSLDSTFNETNLGFKSFSSLISHYDCLVLTRRHHNLYVHLK
jgi:uncharacterized LabA/DUF88 family protein